MNQKMVKNDLLYNLFHFKLLSKIIYYGLISFVLFFGIEMVCAKPSTSANKNMLLRMQSLELKVQKLQNGFELLQHQIILEKKHYKKLEKILNTKTRILKKNNLVLNKQVVQLRIKQADLRGNLKILQNIIANQLNVPLSVPQPKKILKTQKDHYIKLMQSHKIPFNDSKPEISKPEDSSPITSKPEDSKSDVSKPKTSKPTISAKNIQPPLAVKTDKTLSKEKKEGLSVLIHKNFGLSLPKSKKTASDKKFYKALQEFKDKNYISSANKFLDIYKESKDVLKLNAGLYIVIAMMKVKAHDSACTMLSSVHANYLTVPLTSSQSNDVKKTFATLDQQLTC